MSLTPLLLLLLLLMLTSIPTTQANKGVYGGDYCDTEVFRAECSEGEVIIMRKALYGRRKIGRCVEISMGHIGCFTDVLLAADRRCSGKRVCEIRVPDAEFESTRPCLKELKTYLEASYECVQVETVTTEYCKVNDQLNVTSVMSGYIASVMTSDTPYCDGSSHPWLVAGRPGQTINLTLYDFAVESPLRPSVDQPAATAATAASERAEDDVCVQYGLLEDNGLSAVDDDGVKPVAICSDGRRRIQHVYQSVGNLVKIWITAGVAPTDLKRFVIRYTVSGCANPEMAAHTWFRRTPDGHGEMGCQYSSDTVSFRCVDNVWRGSFINCSEYNKHISVGVDSPPPYDKQFHDNTEQNTGHDGFTGTVIFIGIVIGALIGVACIVSLVIIVKLRSGRRQHQQKEDGRHTALLRKTTKDGGGGGSIKMSECGVDKHGVRSPLVNGSPATEPLMSGDGCSTSVNFGRPTWQPQLTPVDIPATTTCSTFKKPLSPAV